MPENSNSRIAGGTINPMRFVQGEPGVELGALQCSGSGVSIVGISDQCTNNMPGTIWTPAQGWPLATAGQAFRVHGDGEQCLLVVGSGYTVMPDNLLTSDASGNGIPLSLASAPANVGARAIEAGVAGDPIRVTVVLRPATGS